MNCFDMLVKQIMVSFGYDREQATKYAKKLISKVDKMISK